MSTRDRRGGHISGEPYSELPRVADLPSGVDRTSEPRVFGPGDSEPEDGCAVQDRVMRVWTPADGNWHTDNSGGLDWPWEQIASYYGPLTEVRRTRVSDGRSVRWYYGPIPSDPNPSKMWHYVCGGQVERTDGGGTVCQRCWTRWDSDQNVLPPDVAGR